MPHSLDVHRVSPIRGQLEPYDPRTPAGCRYIQITDTPDELKILLPPGTAAMYEQLLKLETHELNRKPAISWERIMEIRHLKDRMIRKCQKIAKTSQPTARVAGAVDTFMFQTFTAPTDFRVKEMEKWFREQQRRTMSAGADMNRRAIQAPPGPYELTPAGPSKPVPSRYSMQRSTTNPERNSQALPYKPVQIVQPSRLVQSERNGVSGSAGILSPPPLPILLLSQRDDYGLDPGLGMSLAAAAEQLNLDPPAPTSPVPQFASPVPQDNPPLPPLPQASPPVPQAISPVPYVSPLPAEPGRSPPPVLGTPSLSLRPSLSRRNSAMKRNSMELKTVSWADDGGIDLDGQFRKYASAAREAQASGKFDEVRQLYLDQISGLENLQAQVRENLAHLRAETDHLQRFEETIQQKRDALDATFSEFEVKQARFQEKVNEVLTEANDALARQGLGVKRERDLPPINET